MNTAPRILLVEDDHAHSKLICRSLAQQESHVTSVYSVQEAQRALKESIPDVVLTDLRLPDGNGIELTSWLHQYGCPVIVITSQGDEHSAVEAIKAGALDYVVKSADSFADMPQIVRRALREWQLLNEQKRLVRLWKESDERLRLALDAAHMGTWECNLETGLYSWSENASALLHSSVDALPTSISSYFEWIYPLDRSNWQQARRQIHEQQTNYFIQHRFVDDKGQVRWLEAKGKLYPDVSGKMNRLLGTFADITSRRENEEALEQSKTAAEAATKSKS